MTPLEFLNTLWGAKPADQYILIWIRDGKQSHWFREVTAAAKFVSNHDRDVYVGVGLSHREYGLYNRCPSEEVTGISGLWADFDLRSDAHAKPLPATVEEALSLIPDEFPPTIIIVTGNGIHAWRLFNKPWILANDGERKDAAGLSFRFQTLLRCMSNQRGWTFERLSDLARILRIPGTFNAKDEKNPKPIELHSVGSQRYEPSEFCQYLDKLVIPDSEAEDRAGKDFAERFADHPLVINQDAGIPDDTLAQWMRADMRFGNTWKRQRDDLPDQSQS